MNQPPFIQVPCVKCGATVWIAPAARIGPCPACNTPNQIPAGAAPQGGYPGAPGVAPGMPSPFGVPGPQGLPSRSGGPSRTVAILGGIVAVVVAAAIGGFRSFGRGLTGAGSGTQTLASLGIDPKKGDVQKMIAAASTAAKKWKSDAAFWSINVAALAADGTIDLTDKNVVIEFYSPSAAASLASSVRDDSIKRFNFIGDSVQYKDKWGFKKPVTGPQKVTVPTCTAPMLAAALVKQGLLKPGQTLAAGIDPVFSQVSWIVQVPGKPLDFDLQTCAPRKD